MTDGISANLDITRAEFGTGNPDAPRDRLCETQSPDAASADRDSDGPAPVDLGPMVTTITKSLEEFGPLFEEENEAAGQDSGLEGPKFDSEPPAVNIIEGKLKLIERRIRQFRFHLRAGDYAGCLVNCLREAARQLRRALPDSVVQLSSDLEQEKSIGEGETSQTLEECVSILRRDGLDDVNIDMAKLAN